MLFLSSCGPWCQQNSHLKLICLVSVSSVLLRSSCGPWCQKFLIVSWFALFLSLLCSFCLLVGLGVKKLPSFWFLSLLCFFCLLVGLGVNKLSLLCSFCLLVGLGVKNSHLKLICCISVSSVLFPWCQKTSHLKLFALFLSLLCSFCLLVGLGVT